MGGEATGLCNWDCAEWELVWAPVIWVCGATGLQLFRAKSYACANWVATLGLELCAHIKLFATFLRLEQCACTN